MRFAYRQLYTNFAWTYDAVSAVVSLGEWKEWGRVVIPFISPQTEANTPLYPPLARGETSSSANPPPLVRGDRGGLPSARILELAHGPGHLHLALRQQGYPTVGVDLSPQMGRIARQRLQRAGLNCTLARANVMCLPFPAETFGCVVSTFPTEFIFAGQTLREAARVLVDGGRFIVVPTTTPRRPGILMRAVTSWQRATKLSPHDPTAARTRFEQAGFTFEQHTIPARRADVSLWVCVKRAKTP